MLGAAALQLHRRSPSWKWWGVLTFALGWLMALGAVLSPLDTLGEDGSLSAHIVQHVMLGDLAAPLLLIGLPPVLKSVWGRRYADATRGTGRRARILTIVLSPAGGLIIWALVTYVWIAPPVHRLAIPDGFAHFADHASFFVFGLLVWLAAFDFRRGVPVHTWEALKGAMATRDLPWWGRHAYAMVSRVAMLPAVIVLWLAPTAAYYLSPGPTPGGATQGEDQVRAASLMLGFEMLLSGLAVVLAFIWVSVSDGRARARQERLG